MSPHRERVVRGNVVSEHLVQLFDETESLVASLRTYLLDAWKAGDTLVVCARATNWALTAAELEASGCPVAQLIADGKLVVLDAATTLAMFMGNSEPNAEKFRATVGELVERTSATAGGRVAIYGEMVDILVTQGNYVAAKQLEDLWNQLGQRCSFKLLCGYSSANFGDERTSAHLNAICGAHTHSAARPTDLLATWLLANRRPRYHLDTQ